MGRLSAAKHRISICFRFFTLNPIYSQEFSCHGILKLLNVGRHLRSVPSLRRMVFVGTRYIASAPTNRTHSLLHSNEFFRLFIPQPDLFSTFSTLHFAPLLVTTGRGWGWGAALAFYSALRTSFAPLPHHSLSAIMNLLLDRLRMTSRHLWQYKSHRIKKSGS